MDETSERPRRVASLVIVFLLMIGGLLIFATPTASAATPLYWVQPTTDGSGTCDSNAALEIDQPDMGNTNCWSLTDGGSGGAGVPTAVNDIIFTGTNMATNNVYFSHGVPYDGETITVNDLIVDASYSKTEIDILAGGSSGTGHLVAHSITNQWGGVAYFNPAGGAAVFNLRYSGIIDGVTPNPSPCTASNPGACFSGPSMVLQYTGPANQASVKNVEFLSATASGQTIYCDPGCTDSGGNTNIVFGPVPAGGGLGLNPTPTTPTTAPPTFLQSTVAVGILLLVAGAVVMYLGVVMKSPTIRMGAMVLLIAGALVLVIVAFIA